MKNPSRPVTRFVTGTLVASALGLLAGCATVAQPSPQDPWESLNRGTFAFNDNLDKAVVKPVAVLYRDHVPPLVRTGVSNFFGNLGDAWSAVNALLQFHLQDAEENLARFQLNTMFGLFGIFDPASDLNIERHREDFGQTLGRWGMPTGPYLVLPLLGPSTLRDTAALPVDSHFDLLSGVRPVTARNATYVLHGIDTRANLLRVSDVLEEAALDKYSFVRDAYLQRRQSEVNGHVSGGRLPPSDSGDGQIPEEPEDAPAPAGQPGGAPAR
ncbi:MAG: VacJ family lipoprotein [Burkholderiales bacterium]|nr:VacJ family lipoprotein [Burkholderiales bacterium]